MQPTETPANPSVSEADWRRGLAETCTPSEADGSLDSIQGSTSADPFCGRLVYNTDIGGDFVQRSAPDQDLFGPITGFDVVYASYVGNYGLSTCLPYCVTGGQTVYQTGHDVGSEVGLTDDGETANTGDQGWQEYAFNTLYPNALLVAQQETGAWEMNGWVHTIHDQQFIGFLTATINGQEITLDQDGLDALVEGEDMGTVDDPSDDVDLDGDGTISSQGLKDQGLLAEEATPQVCAYSPDAQVSISAAQANVCEVIFFWAEESEGRSPTDARGPYSNPCDSPAYLCGANQPAWYAQLVCKTAPYTASGSGCGNYPGPDGVSGQVGDEDAPAWSDNDYDIWHFVVAPSPSDCNTAQEPGFLFDTGATYPYLAHDLDVYSPASTAAGAGWTATTQEAAETRVDQTEGDVDQAVDDTLDLVNQLAEDNTPGPVSEAVNTATGTVNNATYIALKDRPIEPNADGDTSQSLAGVQADPDDPDLVRTLTSDPCRDFNPSSETPETVDPWVDYMDNIVWSYWGGFGLTPPNADQSADKTQDASNAGFPAFYYTTGYVGMFTDKNDDGDYDQAGSGSLFTDVNDVGAYPLFWDLWAKEDDSGQVVPDPDGGCKAGFGDKKLTENMVAAGYGLNTGLIQVVYLQEPTQWRHSPTGQTVEYLMGDRVFVQMSNALHVILENGTAVEQDVVAGYINDAIAKIPAASHISYDPGQDADLVDGVTADDRVEFPAREVDQPTDFADQCGQATGGFDSDWQFLHDNTVQDGTGDTIVTEYVFQVTSTDGVLGEGNLQAFSPNGEEYSFGQGVHQWFDVDPFDGNGDRNHDGSSAPPT